MHLSIHVHALLHWNQKKMAVNALYFVYDYKNAWWQDMARDAQAHYQRDALIIW